MSDQLEQASQGHSPAAHPNGKPVPFAPLPSLSVARCVHPTPQALYNYMDGAFRHALPQALVEHRRYFSTAQRGFGEDAFHALWYHLFREFHPRNCVEIGVYRGQTLSLWALLGKLLNYTPFILGISPFSPAGDAVSAYPEHIAYHADTLSNHDYFSLPHPHTVQALSTAAEAKAAMASRSWDLIYIDGCHDYPVARHDFILSYNQLRSRGLIVLDDSSLYLGTIGPPLAFPGHEGPSRVACELGMNLCRHLATVGHNNIFIKP